MLTCARNAAVAVCASCHSGFDSAVLDAAAVQDSLLKVGSSRGLGWSPGTNIGSTLKTRTLETRWLAVDKCGLLYTVL